jgi:hypothetical protein
MPLGLACLSVARVRSIQRQTYMLELYILKLFGILAGIDLFADWEAVLFQYSS